jgi:CHASE2 domain-containing sensor protein
VPVDPPPLPRRTADVPLVVAIGTAAWIVAGVILALVRPLDVWFTTCVVGAVLGGVGFGIFSWQRAAARRGSRLAQRGLD